jgi:tetratricopeptide (TPR) repeat protein
LVSDNDVPVTSEADAHAASDRRSQRAPANGNTPYVPRELTAEEQGKLAALDEALQKFQAQKRWSDVIKTTLEKAELMQDPATKVALFSEAGRMYLERSSNQAEAIKCYRRVLDFDAHNREAIERLKDMYEKRRDWERLVEVMRSEADLLDASAQPARRLELARLATERLRKPAICIDLWQDVLGVDAGNAEAITALAALYERAREWAPLASVLEQKSAFVTDKAEMVALLQKLGTIYADQLNDDQGAIDAFRRLLEVEPEDRRAQEQLKKRYVTAHAWDELESFYAATGKYDELIRTFERAADAKDSELEERTTLLFRVARLWQTQLNAPDRAARAYEKVLTLSPFNLEAAEALTPIYEQAGDAKKLAGVYEVRLAHTEEPDERVLLLREAGLLYEEKLRNPQQAFDKFLEAFSADPSQEVLREDLERLAGKTKDWERLFAAYAKAIDDATHADDANNLRLYYGRVLNEAGRAEDAIAQFRDVWNDRPDDATAMQALDALYRHTQNYAELLRVVERRAELEQDPATRRQLAYDIAQLYRERLGDADRAIEAYRNIPLEFGEGESEAYRALEQLYEQEGRWQDLADTLEHRIDLGPSSDEELAALKFRLAEALGKHLDDKARALDLYCEVLTIMSEHDGALTALEGMLSDAELGSRAASILEPIYEGRGEYPKLIQALEVSLGSIGDPAQRLDVVTRIGEIYAEQLQDRDSAFDVYCRALREAPDSPGITARLEELGKAQNKLPAMVKLLGELAAGSDDPLLGKQLWVKAAQLRDLELGDVDGAVAAYMKALALDEGDMDVLGALEALYRRSARYGDLIDVLRRKVGNVIEPREQEALLAQIAAIQDEMLGEPDDAILTYLEVLEMEPGSTIALTALDGLYERQQMWSELAENVGRQLSMAEEEDQRSMLMLKLASVRETRMGAVDAAIEIYREVLDRDPSSAQALAALERLVQRPEHEVRVAEILEPLYRDAVEVAKLIGIHEIQVRHSASADQKVDLLGRIAELYETQLDDLSNAFRSYARALAEDPGNPNTQEQLERIAATANAWQALAETYEAQVANTEDQHVAASLHAKVADVRETKLGDAEGAIRHYKRVLELADDNLDAATALERLYQSSERYEELAGICLVKAQMLDVPEAQKEYYFRAGQIYEEILDRPDQAIDVYQKSLQVDADDVAALDRLIALLLRLRRWESLLAAYTRKADIADDPEQKKALYAETGAVYERELGQTDKAIETYQRILEIDPQDTIALARLDSLYKATQNWDELLSILEREAELAVEPGEQLALRYRIGELFETRLSDPYRAVEVYGEILERNPDQPEPQAALERMIAAGQEPVQAARVLEPIYRAAAESAKLARVLEVLVAHEDDPVRQVEYLHQIAELHDVHLDQPREAFRAYARALPHDNANDRTLASLERLAERLSAWPELVGLYDAEVARLREDSPDLAVEVALRLAKLCEVQIGSVDDAIARYRIVYEIDPTHPEALAALDRLYESTERWPALAEIVAREAEVAGSPDDVLDLQFRLGQLQQQKLGNVNQAIEQYREILAAAPEYGPACAALEGLFAQGVEPSVIGEILEPLYRMQDAWDKLIGVQESVLRSQSSTDDRVGTMHRIVEIAEQRMNDDALAFTWMQRALIEDPTHDHSASEVERLAGVSSGFAVLADTYVHIIEQQTASREISVTLGKRLARVYEEELADVARAEEAYRYVVAIDDRDEDVLSALDRIYSENGAGNALAEVLRKRVAATSDASDKLELMQRLGNVLYNDVADTAAATEVFRQILEQEPEREDTLRALQNVYLVTQNWQRLYEVYEKELDVLVGDSAQAEILGRMAMLSWTKLDDRDRAVTLLRRVLDLLGEDPEALNALGNIYALQENWADLVDVLEREVAVCDDDAQRVRIYGDLGRIWYEKLHRDRNALESWERVLDLDPSYTDALFAIAEIHRAAGSYSDLVDTLHRVIDVGGATLDDVVIEGVYMQLGAIFDQRLAQPGEAVDAYRRALELNPRNFGAMDALERIHGAEGQWEDGIAVMGRRADALEDPRQKILVLLEIAKMWEEKLGSREGAIAPFTKILEIDRLHDFAFAQLEALYREQARFSDLIELYVARVEATEDTDERVRLLRAVAQVNEKDLGDKNQAFDALLLAWTQDFTNEESARELERMAGLTQRWNELLVTANNSLQEVAQEDLVTKNAICLKCARWYAHEGHPEYAIPYLQQVLAVDPLNLAAMKQMADLYQQTQQWQVYAQVLRKLSEMTEVPRERAEVCVRLGQLQEEQFHSPEQAIKLYRDALVAVPTQLDALKALERIHRNRSEWSDLVDVLKRKVQAVDDPELLLAAKLELAEAYEDRVSDKTQAIEQYRRVLEEDATNMQALKGLERLYQQQERWPDLMGILERQLEVVSNEREQIALLMRVATMWETEFLKHDKAAERLDQVLQLDPTYVDALQGLERLYRHLRRWSDLIATYERHIDATSDRAQKAELYQQIGKVYRDELADPERAIEAFVSVTAIDDDNLDALTALAELYEKRSEHSMALDAMERLARLLEKPEDKVALFYRMGKLYSGELGDHGAALEQFQKAIDLDDKHLPSLEAMRDIYLQASDWRAAARMLEQASGLDLPARRGAELRVELGGLYADKLDEPERAIECFEDAIKLDADNAGAARPLVDAYVAQARYKDAEPLVRMLVRSADVRDPAEKHRFWFLYGQVAENLGDDDTAVKAYGEAFAQDSQDLASLNGLAAASFRKQDWDNAHKYYQMLLVQRREELTPEQITDALYRLGVIKREQGELKKAFNMFDKALEENGLHRPTLEALIDLHGRQKEWEQVIHYKKRMLECAVDDEERFRLYDEAGSLWQKELQNSVKAIDSFVEALALQPSNHVMLHKLLQLYTETAQWERTIEIIDRISDLGDKADAKAKYANAIGVILRDELKDADAALGRFDQALDLDPIGMLKAFEAINRILTQKKDWKGLERAFRKMLHRVTGKGDKTLEFNLWHNLGVIYRDRMRSFESAAEAFGMASRLQPENMQEHVILAEIYAVVPERLKDAVAEHHILLREDPYRVDSYRQLYKLYFDAREYDNAWCVAAALGFLKKADAEHTQFYEQYKPEGPIRPKARLTNERWVKDLFHPEEDYVVGKLFEAVTPALLRMKAQPDKTWQLRKKDLIPDLMNTTVAFARTFGFATQVLSLPLTPRLFVCTDRQGGLAYATTLPPASVCGSALLSGVNPLEVIFIVGKHLSYYRGEHFIRAMFQTKDELKLVLAAAMQIAGAEISDPHVDQLAKQIRGNMQPADLELLNSIGKRFVEAGARTDVKKWMRMVELTGCRAGFLLCNNLEIAARMIQAEPPMGAVEITPKEKIEELLLFSVSEQYFRLREALGIRISVG